MDQGPIDAKRAAPLQSIGGKEVRMPTFEQLKSKYQPVIDLAKTRGVHLKNVHVEHDKLLIRGEAPSQDIKNEVWDQIKVVDSGHADLTADIGIDASLPVPARLYQVVAGDTLSKISKQFYGNPGQYLKIFEANKDLLKDPDHIKVGQTLKVPD